MKDDKKKPIHHPHDGLFKTMLRTPEVAIDLLKARLEPHILKQLDLATFKLENSSFIDERLKKIHSDLVFSMKYKAQEDKCYLYFLLEHQTKHKDNMTMRLWEYNTKLMRQHITQGGNAFPVIFNFIFYTGKKPYSESKSLLGAFKRPDLFLEALQRNTVIELNKEDNSKLVKAGKAALLQLLLKYEKHRDFCRLLDSENLQFAMLINKTPHLLTVFLYMLDREKHAPAVLLEKMNKLTPNKQDEIMTGLQRLRNEGIKLGKQEGIKLGEQRGIKLGEQRGIKLGKQEVLQALIKKGIITKEQADKL